MKPSDKRRPFVTFVSAWFYAAMACLGLGAAAQTPSAPPATPAADCPSSKSVLPFNTRMLTGSYTIDGKRGKFVCQARDKLEKADPDDTAQAMGFGARNRSEFQDRLLRMPETQARLQTQITRIADAWPYAKPANVKVIIVGSPLYSAEALPDNSIKVHLGLLYQAETDEEVSYILAHEYAHLALRHLNRNKAIQSQNRMLSTASEVYANTVRLSQSDIVNTGAKLTLSPRDKKRIDEAQRDAERSSQQMRLVLDVLSTPAWKRSQEDQADALGYDLLRRARIKPEGSYMAFSRLAAAEEAKKTLIERLSKDMESSLAEVTTTKLEALKTNQIDTQNLKGEASEIWKELNRTARAKTMDTFRTSFNKSHRPVDEREKGLRDYVKIAYVSDPPLMVKSQTTWLKSLKTPEFTEAERAVSAVEGSATARRDKKFPEAHKALAAAQGTRFAGTAMVNNERARLYADQGNIAPAHQNYLIAHKSDLQSVDAYKDHLDLLMANRMWPQARVIAVEAIKRYKDENPFLPPLVKISLATGREADLVKYLNQCVAFQDSDLVIECAEATPAPDTADFKRLKPATQTAILRAHGKTSDSNYIASVTDKFNGVMDDVKKATNGKDDD